MYKSPGKTWHVIPKKSENYVEVSIAVRRAVESQKETFSSLLQQTNAT